jgi:hypothetical protein
MSWSFDATDAAGNTRHIEVADGKSGQCPTDDRPGKPDPDAATAVSTDWPRPRPAAPPPVASTAAPKPALNSAATTPASPSMTTTQPPDSTTTTTDTTPGELTPPSTGGSAGRAAPRVRKSGSSKALPLALAAGALVLAGGPASVLALRRWRAGQGQSQSLPDRWQW